MSSTSPGRQPGARVTLVDVARVARVDPSVVSRVINRDARLVIKDETRERVLTAIRELNYHPNAAARSLRTAQSGAFGLLIPDFANPIYAEIIKGAEQAANEEEALLLVGTADPSRPDRYAEMLASGRVEGLLLAAELPTEAIAAITAAGRPVVSVNQRIEGVDRAILADDERAARIAVTHLIELGHTSIAHIRGPVGSSTAGRRLQGYRGALRNAGLAVGPIVGSGYRSEHGSAAMTELLALEPRPTAVLVANVAAAVAALAVARHASVRVPEDLSVVAIHDIPLAANLSPALTTVRMPLAEMGRTGLLAVAEDGASGITVVAEPTELIVRESTGPSPAA
jgi:DNA-binding LacI/PurR family transcriptional regulator